MLLTLFVFGLLAFPITPAHPVESEPPSVEALLARALERARQAKEADLRRGFRWKAERISIQYGSEGDIKERAVEVYRAEPVGSGVFERLVEKNGQAVSESEARKQDRQRQEYFEKIRQNSDEGREEVQFDQDLVDRFEFKLEGSRELRNRATWALSFEPRPGKLPNERRIDTALNNSRGVIFIDQETYEVSRVEFGLMKPIRIWWGIIGRLSEVSGIIERDPIAGQTWLPTSVDIIFRGRILFNSLHRRIQTEYSDFEPVVEAGESGSE